MGAPFQVSSRQGFTDSDGRLKHRLTSGKGLRKAKTKALPCRRRLYDNDGCLVGIGLFSLLGQLGIELQHDEVKDKPMVCLQLI